MALYSAINSRRTINGDGINGEPRIIQNQCRMNVTLSKPTPTIVLDYDTNVWRGLTNSAASRFGHSTRLEQKCVSLFRGTQKLRSHTIMGMEEMGGVDCIVQDNFSNTSQIYTRTEIPITPCDSLSSDVRDDSSELIRMPINIIGKESFAETDKLSIEVQENWNELFRNHREFSLEWGRFFQQRVDSTRRLSSTFLLKHSIASKTPVVGVYKFSEATLLDAYPWVWGSTTPPPPPEPDPRNLSFECPWHYNDPDLNFAQFFCIRKKYIIARRFYYMLHEINLKRVSDNQAIEISRVTATADEDSYAWRFDFTVVGRTSYDYLKAYEPMELELTINDYTWTFFLVDIKASNKFGSNSYSATGVGYPAYLSDAYSDRTSYKEATAKTVEQLANYEIAGTDWTLTWDTANWLVPMNTWSYQDKSPIENLAEIAKATGSIIIPDRELKVLTMKKKFPAAPWNFSSEIADIVLPVAPIISQDYTLKKGANYNAVYATGTTSDGIIGYVKKSGTAGDIMPSSPLTHPLITHVDGARAYGEKFIYESLDHYEYSMTLPLIATDVTLMETGSLLKVNETTPWKGLITGVQVSVSLGDRAVSVRQNISIDRYI